MMETIAEYGGSVMQCTVTDVRKMVRNLAIPWCSELEEAKSTWQHLDHGHYDDTMMMYCASTGVTQIPDYSSFILPAVDKDVIEYENALFAGVATEGVNTSVSFGTRSVDVNKLNRDDLEFFRMFSDDVVRAIMTTDFEDGMGNDVTELIQSFMRRNKFITYNWLNELYGKNIENPSFVEGLLRVLAIVTEKGEETILMPLVVAGLRSDHSAEQEAAIMVIEEWRTKECLDALKTSSFVSGWVRRYAEKVEKELVEELG